MYLNKNNNTVIKYKQEIAVGGVVYPKQVFDDLAKLSELNIVVPTIEEKVEPLLNDFEEVINFENNTVSYIATPKEVLTPFSITRVQAMKQMKVLGLWENFKTILASNEDAQDEWDLATLLEREHEFIAMLAPALGLSEADIDNLFIEASKI